ncbi:DNA polymerase III subunit theta [Klebsiella grimontii]|uniref:DNA polymerase III subunit theta n=1 Tax=Klebsiella grimontii TaxID=2058152 RepID=UPI0012B701F6|nr:DNA polymerase III subunit theta [Klebsiella grimontii]MDG9900744.1 DNA polymerase III subunit theta [Klebsiella grimontii]
MSFDFNLAPISLRARQGNIDLAASGVAYKERLNMPVVAEVVAREQPEHLREYFMERIRYYREQSIQLPRASDPRYVEMEEANKK